MQKKKATREGDERGAVKTAKHKKETKDHEIKQAEKVLEGIQRDQNRPLPDQLQRFSLLWTWRPYVHVHRQPNKINEHQSKW